jgi:SAM-dependent methyltransferase
MSDNTWFSDDMLLDKPNPARIYDYLLGGYHNFEADRVMADKMNEVFPEMQQEAHSGRMAMRRYINFLVEQGIDQFLDIGSGLPTLGNVHELAQAANPAARVVYVDIDPVAVEHGRAILHENPDVTYIRGDVCQPAEILGHDEVQNLLDLRRPVAVVLSATLAYVTDDEVADSAVRTLRDAMAPGSYIVIVHASFHEAPPHVIERLSKLYGAAAQNKARTYDELLKFFVDFELVEPGLVGIPSWRPEGNDEKSPYTLGLIGVGRLPAAG